MQSKKGFLEISFGWLFAIIVGAVILFLAIFASVKLIRVGQYETSVGTQEEIEILLNPLETGFESGRISSFSLTRETRIHNTCDERGTFGSQKISLSQKSFGGWSEETRGTSFQNKYIFSGNISEGKEFILFSRPFEFPFKVSDLIYLIPKKDVYCFVGAEKNVEDEIAQFGNDNLILVDDVEDCGEGHIKVCFSEDGCDISVDGNNRFVEKNETRMYFDDDSLMYGAIFSDPVVYECQLDRLMARTEKLSQIYLSKISLISSTGCESDLDSDLVYLREFANGFDDSRDLISAISKIENIGNRNEDAHCKLW